ncbi:hypothetical protein JOC75_000944 [Metabacillus crassostreae]|nr:hypothetical protein [Metabacillus crassostreae]
MDLNPQSTHTVNIVTKKKFTIRKVLNLYGIFTFVGLIVSIFTIPLTFNVEMGFSRYEMELKDIKKFITFIFASGFIYFFLVNVYHIKKIGRRIFFLTLILVLSFSIFMIFYLLSHQAVH